MRKIILMSALLLSGIALDAQQLDTLLQMKGLYGSMPSNVHIDQSDAVGEGFRSVVGRNAETETFTGFRIKLFQSSAQTAREESARIVENLSTWYPDISVYRSFSSPYFKVTAGDFRTRVDAERLLRLLRSSFPTATIVKEKMKYPSLD